MAITFVGAGTADAQTAASTSSTPGYPSGLAANDLMLMFGVSGAVANNVFQMTGSMSSWTQIAQLAGTGNTAAPSAFAARKFATGSESGTITAPHTNVVTTMGMLAFRGVDTSTPLDISVVTVDKTTANSSFGISTQSLVTNGDACAYVASGVSTTATGAAPTGFTEDFDHVTASTRSWNVGHKLGFSSGATGSIVGSWSGSMKDVEIWVFLRAAVPPVSGNSFYKNSSGVYTPGTMYFKSGGSWV